MIVLRGGAPGEDAEVQHLQGVAVVGVGRQDLTQDGVWPGLDRAVNLRAVHQEERLLQTDAVVGIQDMGAAGLTCSTCEMGSRGGAGVEIDVMHVPQRETGMTPYEIMLSESQERMLLVVKKGREAEVEAIFDKWDLHAAHIGEVTTDGLMRVKDHGKVVAEIPNTALVDEAERTGLHIAALQPVSRREAAATLHW